KTGVLARTIKDWGSYKKEVGKLTEQIEAMKASGQDEHDISHRQMCLDETLPMLPDTKTRLAKAIAELEGLIHSVPASETATVENEIYKKGAATLAEGKKLVEDIAKEEEEERKRKEEEEKKKKEDEQKEKDKEKDGK
ncbi:MAG: hypothetical protein EZS28_028311, partial [Streblomastix strix]